MNAHFHDRQPAQFAAMTGSPTPGEITPRAGSGMPLGAGGLPPVLDACCSSRLFWFDPSDERAIFMDKRAGSYPVVRYARPNAKAVIVDPDVIGDFTAMPFPSDSFLMVVFDPPHMSKIGDSSTTAKTYGKLVGDWRTTLADGFKECFRVLKPGGTLIFKWCEFEVPLAEVLALTPEKPLFGTKYGKREKTHWLCFLKGGGGGSETSHRHSESGNAESSNCAR